MSDKFARDARLSACRARRELPLAQSRTIIWFDDAANSTSNIKFIRQSSALDIGKLQEAHKLYWKVRPLLCERALRSTGC